MTISYLTSPCESIYEFWSQAVDRFPDRYLCRAASAGQAKVFNYSVNAFWKRASRIGVVFRQTLKLPFESRILVLTNDPVEMGLVIHGAWLAGCTVVIADPAASESVLADIARATDVKTVVFPPESAAHIVQLYGALSGVETWIASGGGTGFGQSAGILSLEELSKQAAGDELQPYEGWDDETDLLICEVNGVHSHGTNPALGGFSAPALLEAAQSFVSLYPEHKKGLMWHSFPLWSFHGVLYSYVAPLFCSYATLVRPLAEERTFWRQIRADDVHVAILDDQLFRTLSRRTRPSEWMYPEGMLMQVHAQSRLAPVDCERMGKEFETAVFPCFSLPTAGGMISGYPLKFSSSSPVWTSSQGHAGVGPAMADVTVRVTEGEIDLPEGVEGDVYVKTPRQIRSFYRHGGLASLVDESGFLPSEMLGHREGGGLFLRGARENMAHCTAGWINLDVVEDALWQLQDVVFARAVAFPISSGFELGAFIVLHRLSQRTRLEVEIELSEQLDADLLPKAFEFGEMNQEGEYGTREEIVARFRKHSSKY